MFDSFIQQLEKELRNGLPGENAQLKMAPAYNIQKLFHPPRTKPVQSAVLILIYKKNRKKNIILIKRTNKGTHHAGQISLPGGKFDLKDNILQNTALRETFEEIGTPVNDICILGSLSQLYIPPSNFMVTPFVGFVNNSLYLNPSENEVDEIIEVSLNLLFEENTKATMKINKANFIYNVPCYNINGYQVWGATAMILSEFSEIYKKIN